MKKYFLISVAGSSLTKGNALCPYALLSTGSTKEDSSRHGLTEKVLTGT